MCPGHVHMNIIGYKYKGIAWSAYLLTYLRHGEDMSLRRQFYY